jgi:hypothetical protein
MLASIDVPVGRLLVIANGINVKTDAWVIHLPSNLGVAASWNLAMKVTPQAAWWAIVNDDIVFAPGDLARLGAAMADPAPRIATLEGFAAFGINTAAHDALGWFDENFHPAYLEDCDMEHRARLVGVPIIPVEAHLTHERSSTIGLPEYRRENGRTYPANVEHYSRKWGGGVRGGEVYPAPFNGTGDPNEWSLDPRRLRELGWETTMREPEADESR